MNHRGLTSLLVTVLALAWLAPGELAAQCAMCRTAFESPEGRQLASAFSNAVLFLLAAPFASFGIIGWVVYRRMRRSPAASSIID